MTYTIRPARRDEAKPLIGFYAESQGGKTYSALLLARGFVGPKGKIVMIETESGRGESYADYPEIKGYDVISLREDFSPKAYGEAIAIAERADCQALIIDSASHEWEGTGGVLDLAAKNQEAGKKGVLVWQQPKIDHQRYFMGKLLQTPIALVIVCMRAKYPMVEKPKPGGGKEWIRSEELDPKQSDDILFELFIHGWFDKERHNFHVTRYGHKDLQAVIPNGQPITLETGAKLRAWARGESAPAAERAEEPEIPGEKSTTMDLSNPVIADAHRTAGNGVEAFRQWWSQADQEARAAVNPHREELKQIAEKADADYEART